MIEFSPFIEREFILKPVSVWLCFPRQQKQNSRNEGLIPQEAGAQPQGMRASFRGMECVKALVLLSVIQVSDKKDASEHTDLILLAFCCECHQEFDMLLYGVPR